jgi:hypothetical protein
MTTNRLLFALQRGESEKSGIDMLLELTFQRMGTNYTLFWNEKRKSPGELLQPGL